MERATSYVADATQLSFSGIIDQAIVLTGGGVQLPALVSYGNTVVREILTETLCSRDLYSEIVTQGDTEDDYEWERPALFRSINSIEYIDQGISPKFVQPGRLHRLNCASYYGMNDNIVLQGLLPNLRAHITYYKWAPPLRYYTAPAMYSTINARGYSVTYDYRQAYYDSNEEAWYYLQDDNETYLKTLDNYSDTQLAVLRKKAANWLIIDWPTAVLAGILSKHWTQVGDQTRSVTYYSQYQQGIAKIRQQMAAESMDY